MPSLLELVTSLLGDGDTFDKLGGLIGGDTDQAKTATGLAVPAILGGLAASAQSDSGLDTVMGMLDDNRPVLDDLGGFLERGEAEAGNNILDRVFGGDRADLVSALASKADMGGPIIGKLLPMLAPIVATVVGNERAVQELDGGGVAKMLAEEQAAMESEGIPHTLAEFTSDHANKGADAKVAAGVAGVGAVAAAAGAAAKGAVADGAEGLGGAAEAVADKVGGAAGAATDKAGSAGVKAKAAVTSGVKGIVGDDDDHDDGSRSGLGWLWWALGAVALVLLLAWLLSQCNDSEDVEAGGTTEVAVDGDADADGDSDGDADGASDSNSDSDSDAGADSDDDAMNDSDADSDSDGDDDADSDSNDDASPDADLQTAVDAALARTGVTGAVDDGVVTLTGTVDDDTASEDAEDAVSELDGVSSVKNDIEVGDDDATDGEDQEAESGDTINELLDLDPVTFRVSSAAITDAGKAVLDNAAAFMVANPTLEVEIGGHTDNDGGEAENLDLSQRRADAVKTYLVSEGVDGDRMETKGYGESEPKVSNNSASAKAENRRIEFTIL